MKPLRSGEERGGMRGELQRKGASGVKTRTAERRGERDNEPATQFKQDVKRGSGKIARRG